MFVHDVRVHVHVKADGVATKSNKTVHLALYIVTCTKKVVLLGGRKV